MSFDPNVRRRLWPDEATLRAALTEMFSACDIALPSFDDEAAVWGDAARAERSLCGSPRTASGNATSPIGTLR